MEFISEDINASEVKSLQKNQQIRPTTLLVSGKGSRCELTTKNALWRLGSLSFAKWPSTGELWLHSGSALYCSETNNTVVFSSRNSKATFKGKGTIIVEALHNGGFKFIPVEALGTLTTTKGDTQKLQDGRMLLVLNSPSYFGDAYDLDLMLLLRSSRLINSYPNPLPTFDQIGLAIYVQQLKLKGKYDALIGNAPTIEKLEVWAFGKNTPKGSKDLIPRKKATNKKKFWNRFLPKD
jgi:hypothetical protein